MPGRKLRQEIGLVGNCEARVSVEDHPKKRGSGPAHAEEKERR
jgi:hypothetical protein